MAQCLICGRRSAAIFLGFIIVLFGLLNLMLHSVGSGGTALYSLSIPVSLTRWFDYLRKPQYPLVVWSSDFHISPVADIKLIMSDFGVTMIDKSLSEHCFLTNTCEGDLKVITQHNGIKLEPCPNALRREFYDVYRTDAQFLSVDAILCTHAASMCELFMPFNKSLLVVASTRYEIGRHEKERWEQWNANLRLIASRPGNIVAANNRYDQEYIRYFTGINDVLLLPSLVGYVTVTYSPTRPAFLLGPSRGVNQRLQRELRAALDQHNSKSVGAAKLAIAPIRDLYTQFQYSDLAAHPGVVWLPYQVSFMSLFEVYRMGVPMFVPAPELLATWHVKMHVLSERSWNLVYGVPSTFSEVSRHKDYSGPMSTDPNNEYSEAAVLEWIRLADFYQWPHIVQFSSFAHLLELLTTTTARDRDSISRKMLAFSRQQQRETTRAWRAVMRGVQAQKKSWPNREKAPPENINVALEKQFGVSLKRKHCYLQGFGGGR